MSTGNLAWRRDGIVVSTRITDGESLRSTGRVVAVSRWGRAAAVAGTFLSFALLGACGNDGESQSSGISADGSTTSSTVDGTSPVEELLSGLAAEVAEGLQFPEVGMSQEEIECLAVILADGAESAQDALDRTAPCDSPTAALEDLAPDCFTPERLVEIQAAFDEYEQEVIGESEDAIAGMMADVFLGGGATRQEAECLASIQAADVDASVPLYGTYDAESEEPEPFLGCGSAERVAEIFTESYRAPLREQLVAAGASPEEASCLVEEIDMIDLWLPSGGSDDGEMAADIFERDGAACASSDRLRAIALALHSS